MRASSAKAEVSPAPPTVVGPGRNSHTSEVTPVSSRDIWLFDSRQNSDAYAFQAASGTTKNTITTSFRSGEVCTIAAGTAAVVAGGTIDPSTGLIYLAAVPSEGLVVKAGGLAATSLGANSPVAPFIGFESGIEFITRNVFNNADTNIGPAGTGGMAGCTVGADCDLWRQTVANGGTVGGGVNGDFGIDLNGDWFTITDILNAQGQPTSQFGGTPNWVVFERLGL